MRKTGLLLFLIGLLTCTSLVFGQAGVTVSIDKIVMNDHVSGKVSGLTNRGTSEFKVVAYVKTDKWYIHPYERGGDGRSFASINSDGLWEIETVRRDFAASEIAVLVVEYSSRVPSQVMNVRTIPNKALNVRKLEGTDDYGKL